MTDLPDFELRRTTSPEPDQPPPAARPSSVWIAVTLLVAAAAVAGYVVFVRRQPIAPAPTRSTAPAAATSASPPLGGKGDPITLPPLDASDTLVRTLVQGLTESPAVMAWLPTTGLIRNFTVVVSNIAEGATPARQLKVLRPQAPFRIAARGATTNIHSRRAVYSSC